LLWESGVHRQHFKPTIADCKEGENKLLPAALPRQVAAQEEISQGQKSEKKDAGIVVVKRSISQDTCKKGYQ